MEELGKALVWLYGEIKTPPFSADARRTAGFPLWLLRLRTVLSMPDSRQMPAIGHRCHELRLRDAGQRVIWRIVYRIDHDAIVIGDVFTKKSQKTPPAVIDACRRRYRLYDEINGGGTDERK
jgi:phage-related protein